MGTISRRQRETKMALAIRVLAVVKAITLFGVRRPKDAAIILLAMLLAMLFWRFNRERVRAQELTAKLEGLPPNTKHLVTIYRDRVVARWKDGPTKVQYIDRYLPPEGHVEILIAEDAPQKPPEVAIKDRGFTARLGGGVVYAGKFVPLVDVKLAYWKRYSLSLGITPQFGGAGISRHIDDFTPFHNLEVIGLGGVGWQGARRLAIGLRTNF